MKTKLVIFGITGDLAQHKLLPALAKIVTARMTDDIRIVGVSRREVAVSEIVKDSVLADCTIMFTMDLANAADYVRLKESLTLADDEQAVIYLSVPPGAAGQIVELLGKAGLNTPNIKLLLEKPFGFDTASAQDFIAAAGEYYQEDQLYRIDHYMAKEVATEVIRLRQDAATHHHSWDNQSIKAIDIVVSETLGVASRAVFYEQTGALRDVVQGHLLQLLSLVLMDASSPAPDHFPARRLAALEQLAVAAPDQAARAQYDGYQAEVANPGSQTETFACIRLTSDDPRWQGVAITLTTGKQLDQKRIAITIQYHDGTTDVFEEGAVAAKGQTQPIDAYERVLVDAIQGRKDLFTTGPEVMRSWQILGSVQEHWAMDDMPLKTYPQGSTVDDVVAA